MSNYIRPQTQTPCTHPDGCKNMVHRNGLCRKHYNAERLQIRRAEFEANPYTEKLCTRCNEVKPFSAFTNRNDCPDGKSSWCKDCSNADQREYRASLALRDDSACGTKLGWKIHQRKHEDPCDACVEAHYDAPDPFLRWSPEERDTSRHGTLRMLGVHRYFREEPCDPCKEIWRIYHTTTQHRMSMEALFILYFQFDGLCWACGILPAEYIDHDHSHCGRHTSCGECTRGLLCPHCNRAEGELTHWDEARYSIFGDYYELTPLTNKILQEWPRILPDRDETLADIIARALGPTDG